MVGLRMCEPPKQSVAEMRKELTALGVYHQDCFEKAELVARLADQKNSDAGAAAAAQAASPQAEKKAKRRKEAAALFFSRVEVMEGDSYDFTRLRPVEFSLGANIAVGDKEMYALKIGLPDLRSEALFVVDTAAGHSIVTPYYADRVKAPSTGVSATVGGGTASSAGLRQVPFLSPTHPLSPNYPFPPPTPYMMMMMMMME